MRWTPLKETQSCYKAFASLKTWSDASAQCASEGAILVTIESDVENEFVFSLAPGNDLWIGYSRMSKSGRWMWEDGHKSPYTNWDRGQPDDQGGEQFCAHMWGSYHTLKWDDRACTDRKRFVCKKKGEAFSDALLIGMVTKCFAFAESCVLVMPDCSPRILRPSSYYPFLFLSYQKSLLKRLQITTSFACAHNCTSSG